MEQPRRFFDLKLDYLLQQNGEPLSSIQQMSAMKRLLASCILEDYRVVAINVQAINQITETASSLIKQIILSEEELRSRLVHYPLAKKCHNLEELIKKMDVISRVTIELNSHKNVNALIQTAGNKALASFDLIALRPLTQKLFENACQVCQCDIITLPLHLKLPFFLKRTQVEAATNRGIYFEIQYSPSLRLSESRRYFLQNVMSLVELTKGKNIIFSSGASSRIFHRSPMDLRVIGEMLGMKSEDALAAVSSNCEMVLKHSKMRKTFKGAVTMITEEQYLKGKKFKTSSSKEPADEEQKQIFKD